MATEYIDERSDAAINLTKIQGRGGRSMNANKLKEMGLTSAQIDQVITEHNRVLYSGHNTVTSESLEAQRKRDEIMAIKDVKTRQELIRENMELFKR